MTAPARAQTETTASALQLYDEALRETAAGRPHTLQLCDRHGASRPLPLGAWHSPRIPGDQTLLGLCRGATLDVGCGPGRLTAALATRSRTVFGIDISAAAVELTRRRGGSAARASVFDPLPDEGAWNTVLLADGNIGIGGEPGELLARSRSLLARRGQVVLELDALTAIEYQRVRLRAGTRHSEFFGWARVGIGAIADLARSAGLSCTRIVTEEGRWFGVLTRA